MGFDMENLRIRADNLKQKNEIINLFWLVGCTVDSCCSCYNDHLMGIHVYEDGTIQDVPDEDFVDDNHKEITLPELRDLVVLKRNDRNDATHVDKDNEPWFVSSDNKFYSWADDSWAQERENIVSNYKPRPIEKKEMKEYLIKINGAYKLCSLLENDVTDEYIEIPKGSVKAYLNRSGTINFVNADDDYMNVFTHGEWVDTHRGKHESSGHQLVWQRESPNDKLASAEQYRQAEVLPFIDDEPKNVKQGSIEQTLAQRQSQYGCFEDVAFVTQGMIELMRKCNYDKMPASHQMALSMICSKMARIVNGDFNHKDSWHDIGGYAKLIEDEIFDETEMPF